MLVVSLAFTCSVSGQVEICDNGIDDDNDNTIDINDDDCFCQVTTFASLIANPSFEEIDCCPNDKSQLSCATEWIQASTPTADLIHLCDWTGVEEYPPPLPFPDGDGVLGFRNGRVSSNDTLDAEWKEYAGACLLSPLIADSLYQFEFDIGFVNPQISPPAMITLFGSKSCLNLPFGLGDEAFGCPTNSPDWIKLGEVPVTGGAGNRWLKTFIDFIPDEDIEAIAIGPDCEPLIGSDIIYYYFDNLLLTDLASFDFRITEVNHPCDPGFTLAVPDNPDFDYQWYLSGVALAGETSSALRQNYGEGPYQVRILRGASCRISGIYDYVKPSFSSADTVSICAGDIYRFGPSELTSSGSYINTFKTDANCDSTVSLELEVIGEKSDTLEVTIAPGEIFEIGTQSFEEPGAYDITLTSSLGCDSLILLQLLQINVYIPNVFSPNADGINDLFHPSIADNLLESFDMKIFDRWGGLIYQGEEWDGSELSSDVYIYLIEVAFTNGATNVFNGTVTLLR